jgi:3-oxoadipate enol-lactonase
MKWLEVNGAALRCELAGAEGPTVVLIHEAGGSLESWDAVAASLRTGFRVLRYDQRGFGMSERTRDLSLPTMVNDLIALLDALGLDEPCHLVGTAIGGSIALAAAGLYPHRVASVVATSPVTGGLPEAAHGSLRARAELVETQGMRAVTDASLLRSWPPELRQDEDRFEQYRGRYLANDPGSFAALTRAFLRIELGQLQARIQCPTLLVGCRRDLVKPARECADTADRLPRGRYAELDTGHFAGVQAPAELSALLVDFLESVHAST